MKKCLLFVAALGAVLGSAVAADFSQQVKTPSGVFSVWAPTADGWRFDLRVDAATPGVEVLKIALTSEADRLPPAFIVSRTLPLAGTRVFWSPHRGKLRYSKHANEPLPADWMCNVRSGQHCISETSRWLPLYAYVDDDDNTTSVIATSECEHHVRFEGGVNERSFDLPVKFRFFETPESPRREYRTEIRLDRRGRKLWDAVRDATAWMNAANGYVPAAVPEAAFAPLYSTWYDFHGDVSDAALEQELTRAAAMGMKTVILDDGWQVARSYGVCGDWKVDAKKFPDMRAHVDAAHKLGLKYMVWFGVPWAGPNTDVHRRHAKHILARNVIGTDVLDPRFPEVRQELTDRFVRAIRDWDIDGLKLDFLDRFAVPDGATDPAIAENFAGRDYRSVPEAVSRLMRDLYADCTAVKPDLLFEFRHAYIGPAILQAGNMVRVGDCPGDPICNREGIASLRLTSGKAAVHGDMIRWTLDEKPEKAAVHILNSIFATLQLSMMLKDCPQQTQEMIAHWCRFSSEHRGALLKGDFRPHDAILRFPLIEGEDASERILGVYSPRILADCGKLEKRIIVLNATGTDTLRLKLAGTPGIVRAYDTFGKEAPVPKLAPGLNEVKLPVSGYLVIEPPPTLSFGRTSCL